MKITACLLILIPVIFSCNNSDDIADAFGNFESDEIIVSSEIKGRLIYFSVEEGTTLENREAVGLIDTTQLYLKKIQLHASIQSLHAKVLDVESELNVLKEQITNVDREYKRAQKLIAENAATQQQVDELKGQLDMAKKQLSATEIRMRNTNRAILSQIRPLEIQIQQVDDHIQKSIIFSPAKGTVLTKFVEESEVVSFGKPLFKIADLTTVFLRAYISEDQLASVKIGGQVSIGIDSGGVMKMFDGKVTWVSEVAEFTPKIIQTKSERKNLVYAVKVAVSNDGSIKLGMPGELHLK